MKDGLFSLVSRAVVHLVDATKKMQSLQPEVLKDEVRDDVEHFEPYGFTAHPFAASEAIVLNVGASADHSVAIVVGDRRYRLTGLAEGAVAMYDDQGQVVLIDRDNITIEAKAGNSILVFSDDVQLGDATGVSLAKWPASKLFMTELILSLAQAKDGMGNPLNFAAKPLPSVPSDANGGTEKVVAK